MVLLDHFRPPLSRNRRWHSFHNAWATYLAADLNQKLPYGFFAEPNVQFGIEIDVATFQEIANGELNSAALQSSWQSPTQIIEVASTDEIVEISILSDHGGPTLKGAIELISPANKDRPEQRKAFVSKCETYLREGVGVVIVDVVTTRRSNLHHELCDRLQNSISDRSNVLPNQSLYAAAYHPVKTNDRSCLEIWYEEFVVGSVLPTLPLWLGSNTCLSLVLQETYAQTCRSQRLPSE